MGKWRTEKATITIHYTTNGEVIGRITGSSGDGSAMPTKDIMIAYLEEFAGIVVNPINRSDLRNALDDALDNYLKSIER